MVINLFFAVIIKVLGSIILILGFFFAISDLNVVPTNIHALEDALFVLVGSGIFFIAIIGLLGAGSDSVPALITVCIHVLLELDNVVNYFIVLFLCIWIDSRSTCGRFCCSFWKLHNCIINCTFIIIFIIYATE